MKDEVEEIQNIVSENPELVETLPPLERKVVEAVTS